jgi:hypothetical protein
MSANTISGTVLVNAIMPLEVLRSNLDVVRFFAASIASGNDIKAANRVPKNAICIVSIAGFTRFENASNSGGYIHPTKSRIFGNPSTSVFGLKSVPITLHIKNKKRNNGIRYLFP